MSDVLEIIEALPEETALSDQAGARPLIDGIPYPSIFAMKSAVLGGYVGIIERARLAAKQRPPKKAQAVRRKK